LFAVALAVAGLVFTAGAAQAQQPTTPSKVAYVNMQAILDAAPGRMEAESTYAKETQGYRDELDKMNTALQTMIDDFTKKQATLTAAAKDAQQKAIVAKQQDLQNRQAELQQKAQERQNELMAPIMEQVRTVLDQIRVEDGYAMIVSADAVVAADKNLDITDRVVARLRTIAATKAVAPTKPAGPVSAPSGVKKPA
jgi:outer membrane protein